MMWGLKMTLYSLTSMLRNIHHHSSSHYINMCTCALLYADKNMRSFYTFPKFFLIIPSDHLVVLPGRQGRFMLISGEENLCSKSFRGTTKYISGAQLLFWCQYYIMLNKSYLLNYSTVPVTLFLNE